MHMKWTVLADNRAKDPSFKTEHGLSILLETERSRILLDTGASDVFIRNAMQMGIDLGTVDYVFVSHGHKSTRERKSSSPQKPSKGSSIPRGMACTASPRCGRRK